MVARSCPPSGLRPSPRATAPRKRGGAAQSCQQSDEQARGMTTMPEQWTRAERQYVVNGLGVHVAGWEQPRSAEPPLVLLHGLWESWHMFAAFAPRLAERRSAYAVDLRGHGGSHKPSAPH